MLAVRVATRADRSAIEQLVRDAFGRDYELEFVRRVWASDAYLPELELVAEDDGEVVGHVLHSVGDVDGSSVAALAPLAVIPARQRQGIGGLLLRESFVRVEAAGFPLITLLGHPSYYPRFGFERGDTLGIEPVVELADPAAFMVRRLAGYGPTLRGRFRYAWEQ
jgi:predicted N-acetyltransferase YhbS